MKRSMIVTSAVLFMVFSGLASAQTTDPSSWVGVWSATEAPGATMTLANDTGELGGTIVFNFISGPPPSTKIGGNEVHLVTHPQLAGSTLSFQVTRTEDGKVLRLTTRMIDSDRLEMRCLSCENSPTMMMVKFRP
jgi:hypothetical protein